MVVSGVRVGNNGGAAMRTIRTTMKRAMCAACGEPIALNDTYDVWVHTNGYMGCAAGTWSTDARPEPDVEGVTRG